MSSTLEVRHLRLVRAIAEEGGPTRAAARLHLSQSAVSHQLAELEARLGVALFRRVRRRLELTPAGAKLLDTARSLLGELSRVEREIHRAGERPREPLCLAVEGFTSYPFFPKLVGTLARESPLVELRIAFEATREPLAALLRGTLDLAIVSSPVRDAGLVSVPLLHDEWTVVSAPSHHLAKRSYVSAVELGRELLFVPDAPRSDVERLRERIAAERATMPRVHLWCPVILAGSDPEILAGSVPPAAFPGLRLLVGSLRRPDCDRRHDPSQSPSPGRRRDPQTAIATTCGIGLRSVERIVAEPEPTIAEVAAGMRLDAPRRGRPPKADDAILARVQKLLEDEPSIMATEVLRRARGWGTPADAARWRSSSSACDLLPSPSL
ncbi:MAG: LysR family transcriptional regulator [Myxococcales bacterium]|nr:LysR family transcriptional regulator [Myxococcales bacterium]